MRLKVFAVILTLLTLITVCYTTASATDRFTAAFDITGDGKVNTSDARALLQHSAGMIKIEKTAAAAALRVKLFGDCNADGLVNSSDARIVLRYSARIIDESGFILMLDEGSTEDTELVDITSKPTEPSTPPAVTENLPNSLPKNTLLSPKTNHGLGTAKMVITKADYAEMTPANVNNMRSYPLMNPYIKGMIDYVTASAVVSDESVYKLKSGAKIEHADVEYLNSGYVLPDNIVSAAGVKYTEDSTEIYIKAKWVAPICVQFKPQKYFIGYESREYNLSSFTAEYMEVQFSYTSAGSGEFKFPQGSIFKSASWSTASATKVTTLRLYLSEVGKFFGYDIGVTDNGYIRITAKNNRPVLAGKTIVLDPGHGGADGGGGSNGVYEAGINLNTALYLKTMLEKKGATVVMTRTGNTAVSLEDRVTLTRNKNADLFLSIHCDVADSSSASGVSVYYYYPLSMPYAKCLQNGLVKAYQTSVYSTSSANYSRINRDIKFYPFRVARVETCPSVLIELGFLTNAEERATLQKASTQQALAQGICDGIVNYFS